MWWLTWPGQAGHHRLRKRREALRTGRTTLRRRALYRRNVEWPGLEARATPPAEAAASHAPCDGRTPLTACLTRACISRNAFKSATCTSMSDASSVTSARPGMSTSMWTRKGPRALRSWLSDARQMRKRWMSHGNPPSREANRLMAALIASDCGKLLNRISTGRVSIVVNVEADCRFIVRWNKTWVRSHRLMASTGATLTWRKHGSSAQFVDGVPWVCAGVVA